MNINIHLHLTGILHWDNSCMLLLDKDQQNIELDSNIPLELLELKTKLSFRFHPSMNKPDTWLRRITSIRQRRTIRESIFDRDILHEYTFFYKSQTNEFISDIWSTNGRRIFYISLNDSFYSNKSTIT